MYDRKNRLFYIANLMFWILGWGSLACGLWLYTQNRIYSILVPPSYSAMSSAGLCVCVGAMVVIISFIGCIGNWTNSKNLLISFFAFSCLLFVIQCMTGVMGLLYIDVVREKARKGLRSTINQTYGDHPIPVNFRDTWDHLQANLVCCGADNYTDWFYNNRWKENRFVYVVLYSTVFNNNFRPDSCCDIAYFDLQKEGAPKNCGKSLTNINAGLIYKQGCAEPFISWLLQHMYLVGFLSLIFAFIEITLLCITVQILRELYQREKKFAELKECRSRYSRGGREIHDGECRLIPRTNSI